ncbi:carboxylesterase/lipase family protein [Paracoccus pantotrophus]|uniref:carboxylesterase/lipase family protein n=1 Tax=Paracoccus pantotrophus TaxID=82367 RepID=UPI000E08D658|nr:carboxylesterase family protein [Paracoccus pantotrophus]RDD92843.1 carboxylesterase/lipase family protein [Paracoccus pantotrophus]WGR64186.1 carboxylesterase/lipase family protein [Paracoccus pantotrophus]
MHTVATTGGMIEGRRRQDVLRFLGIRYGETTAGTGRFLAPRAVRPRAGVQQAIASGPAAPQWARHENHDPFFAWYSAVGPVSEDCLFLDLFTPSTTGRRPVMVWLHGGGWTSYSGSAPGFDASKLALSEDLVVVTLNHRLGVFGHLSIPDADARFADAGNAGLLDIVLALKWVRENVSGFGGDPDCVTLFGQSGGGAKVAALLAMPEARSLFHRAAIQSIGSAMRVAEPEEAASVAECLARELEMDQLDPVALQTLPMDDLIRASAKAPPARAMIDGRHLHDHPFHGTAPAAASGIPLLVGSTRTECSYYMRADPKNFTLDDDTMQTRLARFLGVPRREMSAIHGAYRETYPGSSPTELLMLAASDQMFKRPALAIATLQASRGIAPVYTYHFEWNTPIEGGRMRSPHTAEIPFIFGTSEAAAACIGAGSTRMERVMMASWAAFARSGSPGNPELPDWVPYNPTDMWTMCLNEASHLESDPGGAPREMLSGLPFYQYGQSVAPLVSE